MSFFYFSAKRHEQLLANNNISPLLHPFRRFHGLRHFRALIHITRGPGPPSALDWSEIPSANDIEIEETRLPLSTTSHRIVSA